MAWKILKNSAPMQVSTIQTDRVVSGDSLENILDRYIPPLSEKNIVVVTSKIISLCQGRVVSKESIDKETLVKQEADMMVQSDPKGHACHPGENEDLLCRLEMDPHLCEDDKIATPNGNPHGFYLTIKGGILLPSAGIDESNGEGIYILYPNAVQETARFIWDFLRKKYSLNYLGVLITDSTTAPLRRGVTGVALGWCGFAPIYSYIGKPDIYGQPLRVTQVNLLDALAASAVLVMGEGNERTPIAIINNAPKVEFLTRHPNAEEEQSVHFPMEEDLYAPLLQGVTWVKNSIEVAD